MDAHFFANRLVEWAADYLPLVDVEVGCASATGSWRASPRPASIRGILSNCCWRCAGPARRRLEELFGPGEPDAAAFRGGTPVVRATTVTALEARARWPAG